MNVPRHGHSLFVQVLITAFLVASPFVACSGTDASLFGDGTNGGGNGNGGGPNGILGGDGGGVDCSATSLDVHGCTCSAGQTHACYDGPAATRNVSPCHDGTQACVVNGEFGQYGPCTGETLPTAQNSCSNGSPGGGGSGPGGPGGSGPGGSGSGSGPGGPGSGVCSPPMIGADGHPRCLNGTIIDPNSNLCCPCTANDCGTNQSCCAAAACAGDPSCSSCTGQQLDPICNGFVDKDCDDFPEDCDQLCCPCKPAGTCMPCPSGEVPCNGVCINAATDPSHCGACDYKCHSGESCVAGQCH